MQQSGAALHLDLLNTKPAVSTGLPVLLARVPSATRMTRRRERTACLTCARACLLPCLLAGGVRSSKEERGRKMRKRCAANCCRRSRALLLLVPSGARGGRRVGQGQGRAPGRLSF